MGPYTFLVVFFCFFGCRGLAEPPAEADGQLAVEWSHRLLETRHPMASTQLRLAGVQSVHACWPYLAAGKRPKKTQ